ncbi:Sodium-dependent nutrient amino acid transporter 1 [Orchesella cincta]|uniref:Sodium-dependent nutrient amino acid transporter 1 n=1 Tax=Orchesella cincta TaxID=48709 RepID=A0A1D2NIQ8_ORCCI|nr:Sodium-dependent nutrient amino acid transporter 1 [Orchesella cincta]
MSSGYENKGFEASSELPPPAYDQQSIPMSEIGLPAPVEQTKEEKSGDAESQGGGAFLIPYLTVLVLIGRPIYFLELTLGQFSGYSQVKCWKCAPFFKGVGYGSMIATMAVLTYYVSIMALTVYYFIASFQKNLPWANCDEKWAGEGNCNGTGSATTQSVPEMFFLREVIKESANIDNGVGTPDWKLSLCLLFSWILIFGTLIRGVHSSGKVAYFTAIFPYFVMIILLVRGLTLDGSWKGIEYFVKPQWDKLAEPGVWYAAVSQCFFSLNTGFGSIIMFSSYNPFNHNIYRDAWIVSFMDTFTSLLAGFTIFAVLGSLAEELGVDVKDVVQGGAGLAFVSYPDAVAKFTWAPQLFAVLFFLMMFTLGLGSAVSDAGAIITIFCDSFPKLVRWHVTIVVCFVGAAVGIVYTTPGGQFMVDLVDFFGGSFVIYTTSVLEVIGIAWIYGVYNYLDDIEFMLGFRLGWYWKICWGILIPIFLTIILVYSLVEDISPSHNELPYPVIALVFGWGLAAVALLAFPLSDSRLCLKNSWDLSSLIRAGDPEILRSVWNG